MAGFHHETSKAGTGPEVALLLACARTHVDPRRARQIQSLLRKDINWTELIQMALRHKTMPLLYQSLTSTFPDSVPQMAMEQLRKLYRANALRNLSLTRSLIQVLNLLGSKGVCAVPYRGPVLAEAVYGDLSLRQFDDLDILVRKQDVSTARETLTSMGYWLVAGHRVQEPVYLHSTHHYAFSRGPGKPQLELHWRVVPRWFGFSLSPDAWERLEPTRLAGTTVLTHSAEDSLLTLCVHSSKHGWERLAWTCDVAELVRARADMDWRQATLQARRLGAERILLLGLALARDLLGTVLPREALLSVQADSAMRPLVVEVREMLFGEAEEPPAGPYRFRLFGFHLRLRESLWGKVRHCLRIALIPSQEDWALLLLPPSLSFLYYLIHPFRLIGKHGYRLLKRLLRD